MLLIFLLVVSSCDVERSDGCISTSGKQDLSNCVSGHGSDGSRVTLENLKMIVKKLMLKLRATRKVEKN